MITIEKLKEYEEYQGYYDGFYLQRVKNATNITTDIEWHMIGNFIQDIALVKKGFASKEFSKILDNKLQHHCFNQEVIDQLKKIADKGW